jgi:hypothetical protein
MENSDSASDHEHTDDVTPVKRKKGVSNVSGYKRNVIKETILKGKAYTNRADKQIIVCSVGEYCK